MNSATPMNRAQAREYQARLLDKGEVARMFGVEIRTVDRMMMRGEIVFVKLGAGRKARVRFRQIDVDKALDQWMDSGRSQIERTS